jgi:ElaB/YqjD/DUF883 family membrane-anchored ribosome-binding protein
MRPRTSLLICAALVLGTIASVVPAPGTAGVALAEDPRIEEARALVAEAEPWVEQANGDTSNAEKKKARRQAHDLLKKARNLYNEVCDEDESRIEELDGEMVACNKSLYWIRKMASVNEFSRRGEEKAELPIPKREEPAPEPDAGDPAPPDEKGPAEPPEEKPEPKPEPTQAEIAATTFEGIQHYERTHPYDIEGVVDLYEQFLAEFPDPGLPQFEQATERLAQLNDDLKSFFKEKIGDDPDAVAQADSKNIAQAVAKLTKAMRSKVPAEQVRAAKMLGNLRSGSGSFPLVKALMDKNPEVRAACFEGLVAIGGARMAHNLTKSYQGKRSEKLTRPPLDILIKVAAKSRNDARVVSPFMGRFVLCNWGPTAEAAFHALVALGPDGGAGLMEALETKQPKKRLAIIEGLADARCYESAPRLCKMLLKGDGRETVMYRNASMAALKKMGKCAVPHMIGSMQGTKYGPYTRLVIYEITGQRFSMKQAKKLRQWCKDNVPDSGC